jgi:zinc ABC transporter, permease protein
MLYTGIILLIVIILFWKEFKIVTFDSEFAKTLGFPSRKIEILISVLIVITVIIGIQAAGVILISAMIISPAVAARQWTNRLSVMVILSGIFGGIAGLTGTLISITESNLPTGPVIVLVISLIVVFSILFSPKRGILSRILINSKKRKMFRKQLENKKIQLSKMKGGMKS